MNCDYDPTTLKYNVGSGHPVGGPQLRCDGRGKRGKPPLGPCPGSPEEGVACMFGHHQMRKARPGDRILPKFYIPGPRKQGQLMRTRPAGILAALIDKYAVYCDVCGTCVDGSTYFHCATCMRQHECCACHTRRKRKRLNELSRARSKKARAKRKRAGVRLPSETRLAWRSRKIRQKACHDVKLNISTTHESTGTISLTGEYIKNRST